MTSNILANIHKIKTNFGWKSTQIRSKNLSTCKIWTVMETACALTVMKTADVTVRAAEQQRQTALRLSLNSGGPATAIAAVVRGSVGNLPCTRPCNRVQHLERPAAQGLSPWTDQQQGAALVGGGARGAHCCGSTTTAGRLRLGDPHTCSSAVLHA